MYNYHQVFLDSINLLPSCDRIAQVFRGRVTVFYAPVFNTLTISIIIIVNHRLLLYNIIVLSLPYCGNINILGVAH